VDISDASDEEKEPERRPFLNPEEKKHRHQSEGNA